MKRFFNKIFSLVAIFIAFFSAPVFATTGPTPIDVTAAADVISANTASVTSIGLAVLAVLAVVVVFSLIRRVMSGR